jgi:hypothetical protein
MSDDIVSPSTTVEALNKTLEAPALDPVILAIANDYLSGMEIEQIASEYGISSDRVTAVVEKREVKAYIDGVYATQGYLNRGKRLALINRVIDQKLEEALETGIFSKKDLLDWVKHLNEIESSVRPKETGPKVAVQVNNYSKLMEDLLK